MSLISHITTSPASIATLISCCLSSVIDTQDTPNALKTGEVL